MAIAVHKYAPVDDIASEMRRLFGESEETCVICREDLQDRSNLAARVRLACGHAFHQEGCLAEWQRGNNTCPECRTVIDPERVQQQASRRPLQRSMLSSLQMACGISLVADVVYRIAVLGETQEEARDFIDWGALFTVGASALSACGIARIIPSFMLPDAPLEGILAGAISGQLILTRTLYNYCTGTLPPESLRPELLASLIHLVSFEAGAFLGHIAYSSHQAP